MHLQILIELSFSNEIKKHFFHSNCLFTETKEKFLQFDFQMLRKSFIFNLNNLNVTLLMQRLVACHMLCPIFLQCIAAKITAFA